MELSRDAARYHREIADALMDARAAFEREHTAAYCAAQRHALSCHACACPIIDAEGNPGYYSEACPIGVSLLRRYEAAESNLIHNINRLRD